MLFRSAIAAGQLGAAASKVESTLAGLLTLAISFLAGFAGLGRIADKIMGLLKEKVWTPIDKALDKGVAAIGNAGKAVLAKLTGKKNDTGQSGDPEHDRKLAAGLAEIDAQEEPYKAEGGMDRPIADAIAVSVKAKHPIFKSIQIVDGGTHWDFNYVACLGKKTGISKVGTVGEVDIPRERMKFTKKTKIIVAKQFIMRSGPATSVQVSTGKILTKKKYGRRHIISFNDMKTHYQKAFKDLQVSNAVKILKAFGLDPKNTKKSVHSKIRSLARKAFNDPENIRIGEQAANSSLGAIVDPTPNMFNKADKLIQTKLDAYVTTFVANWGIPGTPFALTTENGPIEWEITWEEEG